MFFYITLLFTSLIHHFSAEAHERKPNIGFYEHVIDKTRIDPSCMIFVDDKIENVLSARSFGMQGILFDDQAKVVQQIKNLCGDPILRGNRFLVSRKKHLTSVTSNNNELSEVRLFFPLTDTVLLMFPSRTSPNF